MILNDFKMQFHFYFFIFYSLILKYKIWLIGSPILYMILEGYSLFGLIGLIVSILAAISVIIMMIGVNKVIQKKKKKKKNIYIYIYIYN